MKGLSTYLAYPTPIVDLDFRRMPSLDPRITFSRTTTISDFVSSGLVHSFASGTADQPAFSQTATINEGLGIWLQTTNRCLRCRDFTNASWVKSNMTAVLNRTGIDGAANSASTLTATAGNGTVIQSITDATSRPRNFNIFMKRLVGTGEIDMTIDNGTTWTRIDQSLTTTGFTRVPVTTQGGIIITGTNPKPGIRIVTNGDSVAVDYAQVVGNNTNSYDIPSPPILTTSAAVTVNADSAQFHYNFRLPLTVIASFIVPNDDVALSPTLPRYILEIGNGVGLTDRISLTIERKTVDAAQRVFLNINGGGQGLIYRIAPAVYGSTVNIVAAWISETGAGGISLNGLPELNVPGAGGVMAAPTPGQLSLMAIGSQNNALNAQLHGYVRRVVVLPGTFRTDTLIQSLYQ